jgi:ribosomal protein L9
MWSVIPRRGLKRSTRRVEIVMLRDDGHVGSAGSVQRVRPGHMRHTLYPQGVAVYATDANLLKYAWPAYVQQSRDDDHQPDKATTKESA